MWPARGVAKGSALLTLAVAGSKSRVVARKLEKSRRPPTNKTFPLASTVAVCESRATGKAGPALQFKVSGSKSSVLARLVPPVWPPATQTLVLGNMTAVAYCRAAFIVPVTVVEPCTISKTWAVSEPPPANRTRPSVSRTALWPARAVSRVPSTVVTVMGEREVSTGSCESAQETRESVAAPRANMAACVLDVVMW